MFGKQVTLFNMFGFAVRVHASWLIIVLLVTWTLAEGVFMSPQFDAATRWIMGAAGAIGLFVSVVVHELCHSLVARRYGLTMKGITLFLFGGMAEMAEEPPSAKSEFWMAIAGPISSFILGGLFLLCTIAVTALSGLLALPAVLGWLASINVLLAIFNLVPAFPLDGGRVLRSALWGWKGNLRWATKVSSQAGSFFGAALIFLGVLHVLAGAFIAGMWWFLIGMFVRFAARQGYQQVLTRQTLSGVSIARVMNPNPVVVPADLSIADFVEDYVYRYHYQMFPVAAGDGQLAGSITTQKIQGVPRQQWGSVAVGKLAQNIGPQNTISSREDAMAALSAMNQNNVSHLMVVEEGRLAGIVSMKDLMKFASLKTELEASRQQTQDSGSHLPHPT